MELWDVFFSCNSFDEFFFLLPKIALCINRVKICIGNHMVLSANWDVWKAHLGKLIIYLHEWVFQKSQFIACATSSSTIWDFHECKLIANWTRKTERLCTWKTNNNEGTQWPWVYKGGFKDTFWRMFIIRRIVAGRKSNFFICCLDNLVTSSKSGLNSSAWPSLFHRNFISMSICYFKLLFQLYLQSGSCWAITCISHIINQLPLLGSLIL